jgi:hypothetical protein
MMSFIDANQRRDKLYWSIVEEPRARERPSSSLNILLLSDVSRRTLRLLPRIGMTHFFSYFALLSNFVIYLWRKVSVRFMFPLDLLPLPL